MVNTKDLLLEIGTEEIPSGYFNDILQELSCTEDSTTKGLFESQHIGVERAFCYSTPRRIILHIENIPTHQDVVIDGPPVRIAYSEDKTPTKALESFLNKNHSTIKDIEIYREGDEERIRLIKKSIPNKKILEEVLPKVITSLEFPKSMRWNDKDIFFARPIRWIVAVFGNEVLRFSVGDVISSNITRGHRFLGKWAIRVSDAVSYFKILNRNHVIWNNEERKARILRFLEKRHWHENNQLLEEVANLIEWPFFIEGVFKKEYLNLPKEILLASMSKHQRIFCLKDKKGELANRFIAVINGKYRGRRDIRRHYEDVLDARLKDALFFYKADTKKPLSKWADGLGSVIFHKELGTIKDKAERMRHIATFLVKKTGLGEEEAKVLGRAIALCKADLLTQMVREFPSLQGIVGRYYALDTGEDRVVAEAIGEHYLPRFADDIIPQTDLGIICSLSDKLDNIISYFKIGKFPKGNWDLYALRRQGIAIISILLKRKISLSLSDAFDTVYDLVPGGMDKEKLSATLLEFFKERFISYLKDRLDYRYDLMESVTNLGVDDIYNCFLKLESLNNIIEKIYFEKARCIVERTHNIVRSAKTVNKDIKASLFEKDEERKLYDKLKSIKEDFLQLCKESKYEVATELYADNLFDELHRFFDKVMVNVDDKEIRDNRILLLSAINRLYVGNIADLSKIVVSRNNTQQKGV